MDGATYRISLTKPFLSNEDIEAMVEVARQGRITRGEWTATLEREYSTRMSAVGAVATNSGTSALIVGLKALGVKAGDEVIAPSYTCLAVANAIGHAGATPVLADNIHDPEAMDFNICPREVEKRISPRTRAIIVPHMFGVPAQIDRIMAFHIPVIEDATLSLGATYQGRPLGAWGDLSVSSFHASKMVAAGEGGIVSTANPDLLSRLRMCSGQASDQAEARFADGTPEFEPALNCGLGEIPARLCFSQLKQLEHFVQSRQRMAERYNQALQGIPGVRLPLDARHCIFFRYLVALERDVVLPVLRGLAQVGIEAGRGVFPALHRYLRGDGKEFPGAEKAMRSLISVPLYPALTADEEAFVLNQTRDILTREMSA